MIQLADFLHQSAILPELKSNNKNGVLQELCIPLVADLPADVREQALQVLKERETLGSTATGAGIAIPHGKVAGLSKVRVGFGRHSKGADFDAPDGQPVHLFFVILAPMAQQGIHLQLLARISRIVSSADCKQALLAAKTSQEIEQHLRRCDQHTQL